MLPTTIVITLTALSGLAIGTPVSSTNRLQKRTAGVTTRYWDCCKASCAWPGKTNVTTPLRTCDAEDNYMTNQTASSGCAPDGVSFTCSDQGPVAVNSTFAYGTAAVALTNTTEDITCCACYELTFNGLLEGKTMVVQATNTGGDVGGDQFDIAIPGGGQGYFSGCSENQYKTYPLELWGRQYGGVDSREACDGLPPKLQPGCYFRWDWMLGTSNPTVDFNPVTCPQELIDQTGCQRA